MMAPPPRNRAYVRGRENLRIGFYFMGLIFVVCQKFPSIQYTVLRGIMLCVHLCILDYHHHTKVKAKPWKPENAPLQPVISNHFMTSTVTSECTVDEFRKEKNLEANKANVFIEFGDPIIKDIRDVILEDKVLCLPVYV